MQIAFPIHTFRRRTLSATHGTLLAPTAKTQMATAQRGNDQLCAIAAALASRRDAILLRWREAADADAELTTASALSRAQFHDHIPEVLDAFERRLRAQHRDDEEEAAGDAREGADGAGLGG